MVEKTEEMQRIFFFFFFKYINKRRSPINNLCQPVHQSTQTPYPPRPALTHARYLYLYTIYNNQNFTINFANLSLCHINQFFPIPPIITSHQSSFSNHSSHLFFGSSSSSPYCYSSSNYSSPFLAILLPILLYLTITISPIIPLPFDYSSPHYSTS
jgi:hypothetical protein